METRGSLMTVNILQVTASHHLSKLHTSQVPTSLAPVRKCVSAVQPKAHWPHVACRWILCGPPRPRPMKIKNFAYSV